MSFKYFKGDTLTFSGQSEQRLPFGLNPNRSGFGGI
jgi:hypothetical protein